MNSAGTDGAVGGIAGKAEKAYLVDNVVITQNGDSDRIHGKGYIGGIAGIMNQSGIYNSYVNGTIGEMEAVRQAASLENTRVET